MRVFTLAAATLVAGAFALSALAQAAPAVNLPAGAVAPHAGVIQQVQLFPRRYYRNHPYAVPPAAVVPAVPVAPVVEGAPVVVVPVRPASCGEFHYWNGVACVDARYNNPYLGPR